MNAERTEFRRKERILIVGGTGFIGRHLARKCLILTPYVTCLSLGMKQHDEQVMEGAEIIRCDMADKEALSSVICGRPFDYVFNLGGYIDHIPYFQGGRRVIESHFIGLLNLTDCLDIKQLKGFVQIGSSDEYGNAHSPQNESIRESPISPYSLAKTAASHFIQTISNTEGFPGVVLRLFLTYGPGQDDKRFLPQIIKGCLENADFKTSEGKQVRDFCYVDDAVDAMIKASVSPAARGHIINIASGIPVTIRDMVESVIKITGGGRPQWGAYPYRKGENMSLYADIGRAIELLDWKPNISLEDGLRKTIEYYKAVI
ncbi:MAG: NAD-dependent epimerase/dehydratase family protein [Nitrospirae bacterium]|nr:NAD-dependent epimerase/dehydratase family protein [Nitrospirota bacterium]